MTKLFGHQDWQIRPRKGISDSAAAIIPSSFTTVAEARATLEHYWYAHIALMNYEQHRARSAIAGQFFSNTSTDPDNPEPRHGRDSKAAEVFFKWSSAFDNFLKARGDTLTSNERQAVAVLSIQKLILWAGFDVATPGVDNQMLWDKYLPVYRKIVELAATSLNVPIDDVSDASKTQADIQSFSLDIGVVGPLYDTACMCRDPVVRRQATRLLRLASRQDGFWDRMLAAKAADRVIAIEEEGLGEVKSCEDVPDWARINNAMPTFDINEKKVTLRYSRKGSPYDEVRGVVEVVFEW